MSNDVKILLSISLQGVLSQVREEVIIPVTEEKVFEKFDEATNKMVSTKLVKRFDLPHQQRVAGKAIKKVLISEESYNYMTSDEIPDWYFAKRNQGKTWDSLTKEERLTLHFTRISYPNPFTWVYTQD